MTVFVTYRMADALPRAVVEAYQTERRRLDRLFHLSPRDAEVRKERSRLFCDRVDRLLDGGAGAYALRRPDVAGLVMGNLRHHDGSLYTLETAVAMPNHVHVLATLDEATTLAQATHAWKSYTGKEAVKLGCARPFWQDESYDHLVRDEAEFAAYRRYILSNPEKARLGDWPWVYDRGVGTPDVAWAARPRQERSQEEGGSRAGGRPP